jgi:hypothetical protein
MAAATAVAVILAVTACRSSSPARLASHHPQARFGSKGWGGDWSSTPDYQHFSVNGR